MNAKRGYYAIKIGDETLEGHFSMSFLYAYSELKGCELSEVHKYLSEKFDPKSFCEILVCSHEAHSQREGIAPKFSNATKLMDDMFEAGAFSNDSIMTSVTKALTESVLFGNNENVNTGIKRNVKKYTKDPK